MNKEGLKYPFSLFSPSMCVFQIYDELGMSIKYRSFVISLFSALQVSLKRCVLPTWYIIITYV